MTASRAWLAHLLEIPLSLVWVGFWLPPSSVPTVLFEERSSKRAAPRCIGLGDVAHLYAAGSPVRPRGSKGNVDEAAAEAVRALCVHGMACTNAGWRLYLPLGQLCSR